jgi:hypothetical protein
MTPILKAIPNVVVVVGFVLAGWLSCVEPMGDPLRPALATYGLSRKRLRQSRSSLSQKENSNG